MNASPARPASPSPAEIRRTRRQAGLTQAAAGELVHVTENKWSKWESGVHRMQPAVWELFVMKSRAAALPAAPEPGRRRTAARTTATGVATSLPDFAAIVERRALQWAASVCEASMTTTSLERRPGIRAADWNAACAECAEKVRAMIPRD